LVSATATIGVGPVVSTASVANSGTVSMATIFITSDTTAWNWIELKMANVLYATFSPAFFGTVYPELQSGAVAATQTVYFSNATGSLTAGASAATILTCYVYPAFGKTATILPNGA
jgi:hypothetical protein